MEIFSRRQAGRAEDHDATLTRIDISSGGGRGSLARYVEAAAIQSAGPISNSIILQFSPKSVIDVGCGTGALLAAFRERGYLVAGIEYSDAGLHYCRARGLIVTKFDIEQDVPTSMFAGPQYDIAISLDVAEHLPEKVADRYVGLLCGLSSIVIFSAATPGQGGTDHVNEQPHSYWIEKFSACGYLGGESRHRSMLARAPPGRGGAELWLSAAGAGENALTFFADCYDYNVTKLARRGNYVG